MNVFSKMFGNTKQSRWIAEVERIMKRRYSADAETVDDMIASYLANGTWEEFTPEEFADHAEERFFLVRFHESVDADDGQ